MRKTLKISKTDCKNVIIVDHLLKNESDSQKKYASWAITQMKLGGIALLPFKKDGDGGSPFLPNRGIILWPYTEIRDPRIQMDGDFIFVHSIPIKKAPLKIGLVQFQQWIAYYIQGLLFVKFFANSGSDCQLDMGATRQCYCNEKFLELETLGAYQVIKPGETVSHREVWCLLEVPMKDPTHGNLADFVEKAGIPEICQELL